MATFPSKVNYATGDILTATNMNDVGGAINLLDGAQYSGAKNRVLNSNMSVAQRGTSSAISTTVGGSYGVDRWLTYRSVAGSTASQQSSIGLTGIQNALRIQRDSGNTSTAVIAAVQNFETVNSIPLAGKTVVFSFYARAGANYSAASGNLAVYLWAGTGTDQKWATYTGQTSPINSTATLTTSWQRFTYTATLASTITELAPAFEFTPVGTAGANDYFEVTGVQLEAANSASPYAPNGATYQAELAACQRYYVRFTGGTNYSPIGLGYGESGGSNVAYSIMLPVTPRTNITSIDYANVANSDGASTTAVTSLTVLNGGTQNVSLRGVQASGITQFRPYGLINNGNSAGYVGFSAEL